MKKLYNHYFPTPHFLSMNSCAIDISDQSIKYGELAATTEGLHIGKYGKEKIPEGIIYSGVIKDENKLVGVLKNLKNRENLHFIRASLPEEQMYIFNLSLPKSKDSNLKEMILLQIEEHIPLKAEEVVFDFSVIKEDEKDYFVQVSAVPKTVVDGYVSVFNKAGLIPLSFELETQAISRAVIHIGDSSPVMIVDFGDTRTGISISCSGKVFLATTIPVGGANLTQMISKNFSISFKEAEKMKHSYGLDGFSKADDIFPVILNGISVIRDEIMKQYSYWEDHKKDFFVKESIQKIILCGGDANLVGLAEYMSLSLKIKVENANAWTNVSDMDKSVPHLPFEESLGYTTVLGLALGDYFYDADNSINVLPNEEKKRVKREYWMRFSIIILNISAAIFLVATLLFLPAYFFSSSKESLSTERLEAFNKENPDLDKKNLDLIINEINDKLKIVEGNIPNHKINDKVLDYFISTRPENIIFNQILYSKKTIDKKKQDVKTVEIRGTADNREALRNFKTILDENPDFSEVDLPISSFLEKEKLNFTISIILK